MSEPGPLGLSLRAGLVLFAFALAFTTLMALTYNATKDTIAASTEEEKMKLVNEVLPPGDYDNALLADYVEAPPAPLLGVDRPARIFRARKSGAPAALVLEAVAPDGYSGAIALLVAVRANGEIAGVRVTSHRETPGLGDYVDIRKDRNKSRPWITRFNGLSFGSLAEARWRVKKDGGEIDFVSGATISARAVTHAVARALKYALENRDKLFSAPSQSRL